MEEQAGPSEKLRKIEALIAAHEEMRGVLPDAQFEAVIRSLQEQRQVYLAKGEGSSTIGQGIANTVVGAGGVLIEGDVYLGEKPQNSQQALAIYHQLVMRATADLPLRGIDVGASDATTARNKIGLANVYIALDTTTKVVTKTAESSQRKKKVTDEQAEDEQIPLTVLNAVIQNRRLVMLGDPGSGKSTFVNFLSHCLAAGQVEPQGDWLGNLPNWPRQESGLVPVVIILRDFIRHYAQNLPEQAYPKHIWDFFVSRLQNQNLPEAALPVCEAIEQGKALVLLDGLDEVPTLAQRLFVRDAVQAFAIRYPKCRMLVTCRVLSYQPPTRQEQPDLRLPDWPAFELAAFAPEKIAKFIEAWYHELGRLGTIKGEDIPGYIARLKEAVNRQDIGRLAPNPMLLTVMALVHTHRGRLPEARALLYEETIEILLWRWEQVKLGGLERASKLRQLLLDAGRSDVDLKRVLWGLAYEAHSQVKPEEGAESLAGISEHALEKALAALKIDDQHPGGDRNWAIQVIQVMKERSGLLLERTPEVFSFPHRTFQEYLAGAYLASQSNCSRQAVLLAKKGALWREAILYAAGRLVYVSGDLDKPLAIIGEFCPEHPPADDQEMGWRLAWLAGEVLLEIGQNRACETTLGRDLSVRVRQRLGALLFAGCLSSRERAEAGRTLAALGDPRREVIEISAMQFCHVPAGRFRMGSDKKQDKQAWDDELPLHDLDLAEFWIGRFPVSNAQFDEFVQAGGYTQVRYWEEARIAGYWPELGNKGKYRKAPLGSADYGSPFNLPNHPVVGITWYEALAYTRWLNENVEALSQDWSVVKDPDGKLTKALHEGLQSGKLHLCLPSEAEWEKAARGVVGQVYPWKGEFDPNLANTDESRIGTTSALGCFPGGASPYGVLEMSGNVLEWTRSLWDEYPYPQAGKERATREDLSPGQSTPRVLRGGSFDYDARLARCACRRRGGPGGGYRYLGFRVVVSYLTLDSGRSESLAL